MELTKTSKNKGLLPAYWSDLFNSDGFFDNRWPLRELDAALPPANVIENDKSFRIELAVPGFAKKDFVIEADENRLSIYASKKEEKQEEDEHYTRKEFSSSSFERSFTLPQNIDDESIDASYADGVLELVVPKKKQTKALPKKEIKIR